MSLVSIFLNELRLSSGGVACFSLALTVFLISSAAAEVNPDTVVGIWLFDEGRGDVATDASGNGLDGAIEGNPEWVDAKFGKGLALDGVGAHVVIPAHENPTEAITVSIWVKSHTDTWNQDGWMVEKRNAYIIHPNLNTKNVSWPVCNGGCWNKPGGWRDGEAGPDDITQWHMYTTTYSSDTGEWYIYIDGEEVSAMELTKSPIDLDTGPVFIGNDTCCDGRFGDATIDEVAIFSVALERDDIQTMYNEGFVSGLLEVEPTGKMTTT